jgi:hypothetical protein
LPKKIATTPAQLRDAVRRHGRAGGRLRRRDLVDLAVDRPARRGEDDPRAGRPGRLEHLGGAAHVHVGVEAGVGHRHPDVGLGREVEPRLGLDVGREPPQRRAVADVDAAQVGPGGHPLLASRREVVDDDD